MKKTDITIISQLRTNGRVRLTELSRKTGLPVSTIHERIKKHTTAGLLRPSTLLQFDKIGYHARAHILLSINQPDKEKLYTYLQRHTHVNSLAHINNGWNIIMECVFKDMYALEAFVEELEHKFTIKQKQVHYVLTELKREGFLTTPELAQAILTT